MGVMLAKAMGNTVTAISTSSSKEKVARSLGADQFLVSSCQESMAAAAGTLDIVLNCIGTNHDLMPYLSLLTHGGVLCQLSLVTKEDFIS